jgi:hypothetical protein
MTIKKVSVFGLIATLVTCGEHAERFGAADDVLVNDPSVDRGNSTTQSETAVARHGDVVVIGFNDSGEFTRRNSMTGYAYSLDGGATFTDAGVLAPAKGGRNLGDAALAVDRDGNFYFATLALDARARSYVGVAKSTKTEGEVTFSEPVLISGLDADAFQDKELIAVDTTATSTSSGPSFRSAAPRAYSSHAPPTVAGPTRRPSSCRPAARFRVPCRWWAGAASCTWRGKIALE